MYVLAPINRFHSAAENSRCSLLPPRDLSFTQPHTQDVSFPAVLFLSPAEAGVRAGRGCMQRAASVWPASLSWGGWLRTRSQGHRSDCLALTGEAVVMVWWGRTADRDCLLPPSLFAPCFPLLFCSLPFSSQTLHLSNSHIYMQKYFLSPSDPILLWVPFSTKASLHTTASVLAGLQC